MRTLLISCKLILLFIAYSHSENIEFRKDTLVINTGIELIAFDIELAISPEERGKGLMFRNKLAMNQGMLFIYPYNQHVTMWMKNTLIPLDMIFINENGSIEDIVYMTTPNSLSHITIKNRVKAVLEINGGLSKYLKINKGDKIIYSTFN